jgi:hypothetical protein
VENATEHCRISPLTTYPADNCTACYAQLFCCLVMKTKNRVYQCLSGVS